MGGGQEDGTAWWGCLGMTWEAMGCQENAHMVSLSELLKHIGDP